MKSEEVKALGVFSEAGRTSKGEKGRRDRNSRVVIEIEKANKQKGA